MTRRYNLVHCFWLLVCPDGVLTDIMKTPNIASNLDASTNRGSVSNVVPKPGAPDYWRPLPTDAVPAIQVVLPVVNGRVPESYELMEINITANNFNSFVVTVYDSRDDIAFTVSCILVCCVSYLNWRQILNCIYSNKTSYIWMPLSQCHS